ncbi:MAG: Bax inhibitor-1/YccA family protein [Porphyromonas sp.]|nr:Bax inhibitor-1/YccA family protein [Porphyromonas sp.]
MYNNNDSYNVSASHGQARILDTVTMRSMWSKTYGWMALALIVSAFASYVSLSTSIFDAIMSSKALFFGLIIAEFVLVFALASSIGKLNSMVSFALFMVYALLNGITLSAILYIYTATSVLSTFMITSGMFATMAIIGFFTKKDLSKFGSILIMALVGLILASVVNIFLGSSTMYWLISVAGVIIFCGLTAYDINKFKRLFEEGAIADTESANRVALMAALSLYLDFINLFIYLLRLLGARRD